ncbi:MAG: hypothetical protein J0H49_25850 [Acidobacteria bacterium]|nr:hypothetical protein [Acidobacteriota bacterium]
MMLGLFLGLLFQQQFDRLRAAEFAEKALLSEIRAHEESLNKRALAEKRQFAEKYEALGRAMDSFTLAYNAGRGNIWPKKEAEALAKAIREFESTNSWRPLSQCAGDRGSRCPVQRSTSTKNQVSLESGQGSTP